LSAQGTKAKLVKNQVGELHGGRLGKRTQNTLLKLLKQQKIGKDIFPLEKR